MAASGGYYIAAPADEIYAEPTTITGSIGVLAEWPVVKGLLDKVGVEFLTIRSTHAEKWKAKEFNPFETPDPAVTKRVQDLLDTMQARFEEIVKDGRKAALAKAKAEAAYEDKGFAPSEPLTGKTYTSQDALAIGLVDQIGYLPQAVRAAARRANVPSPRVVQYAPRAGLLDALLSTKASAGKGVSIRIDADGLEGLASPRILMIWKP
jgi:protease-4